VANLEAPRRNLNIQCVKIHLLPNANSSQKHYDSIVNNPIIQKKKYYMVELSVLQGE